MSKQPKWQHLNLFLSHWSLNVIWMAPTGCLQWTAVKQLFCTCYLPHTSSKLSHQSLGSLENFPIQFLHHFARTLPQLGGPPAYSTPDTPTSLPVAMGQTLYTVMQRIMYVYPQFHLQHTSLTLVGMLVLFIIILALYLHTYMCICSNTILVHGVLTLIVALDKSETVGHFSIQQ